MRKILQLLLLFLPSFIWAQDCGTSRRRPWRSLSCEEQETFLRACQELKASGRWDELVLNHFRSGDWAHMVPAFLFWHRWLAWIAERELQRISGTCLTIPYWDWERSGSIPSVFRADTFGSVSGRGCVRDGIARNWRVVQNGGCLIREFDNSWRISRDVEVLSRITNNPEFGIFRRELEGTPHTNTHEWVGGPMADRWAVDDPVFFLHHSNVDRMFALWQNYWGYSGEDLDQLGRRVSFYMHIHVHMICLLSLIHVFYVTVDQHYDGRLDDPLVFRYVRQLDWDSPRTGRPPTIRELMRINGNGAIMSVTYEDDNLAQQLVQTSSRFANSIDTSWNNPGRVSSTPRCQENVNAGGIPTNNNANRIDNNNNNNQQPQCRPRNAPCNRNGQCCSRRCGNGTCRRRNNIRALQANAQEEEPEYLLEAPDFEDQQNRWYELLDEFTPMFPELIFEQLAREDCQAKQRQAQDEGFPLNMVSPEWLASHHVPANQTHTYECHSVPMTWKPIVVEEQEQQQEQQEGPQN
jgi:tyrosinase